MSLTLKEVRVPTPLIRARKILAALAAAGDINEYNAAGAIDPLDSVAFVNPNDVGVAYSLAAGTTPGETIRIQLLNLRAANATAVITPAPLTGGTTITFDAEDEYCVLIWDGASWDIRANTGVLA